MAHRSTTIRVRSYELDSFQHANHAVFLNYLEQARFERLAAGGFPYGEIRRRGWGVYVVRLEIDYLAELRLDDLVDIETEAEEYRRTSMVLKQRMFRRSDEETEPTLAAEARMIAVWIGDNGRPMRVPEPVKAAFGPAVGP